MTQLTITATYPLGCFLGHVGAGQRAALPDTARLHAALVHAAGKGSGAMLDGHELRPSPLAVTALRWLEEHPPNGLTLPEFTWVSDSPARSYRDEGTLESKEQRRRKTLNTQSDATALAGPVSWHWDDDVPGSVADTLTALCADVSCLGEADSPVVLDAWVGSHEVAPTHLRDATVTEFPDPGGIEMRTPIAGRVDELERAHRAIRPPKRPSLAADRPSQSAQPSSPRPPSKHVQTRVYRGQERAVAAPWTRVHLLRVSAESPLDLAGLEKVRVPIAVALHKGIVRMLPVGAPPIITGAFATGDRRPANRVAIQLLDGRLLAGVESDGPFLAVLVPQVIDPQDDGTLEHVLHRLHQLRLPAGSMVNGRIPGDSLRLTYDGVRPGDQVWNAPPSGHRRTWEPAPSLVAETRRPKNERGWALADAALLSAAFVFRDELGSEDGKHAYAYAARAELARAAGVQVLHPRLVPRSNVDRHVHRMPKHVIAQPYSATLDMGRLVGDTTLFALGQSRHLGGGLMLPVDYAEGVWPFRAGGGK